MDYLVALDDPISELARSRGPVQTTAPSVGDDPGTPLGRLTRSIIGQQISVTAAYAIHSRLLELLGGEVTAQRLAGADEDEMCGVGLSRAKARSVHELGIELVSGRFSFEELAQLSDDEAQRRLVTLRGIGPWSAQIFLLRSMGRPDVFPADDVGLRNGIRLLDTLDAVPTVGQAQERALMWRPYRSYAAKYLWMGFGLPVN